MHKDYNLETIREKITELKTAIMYGTCNDDIMLPNTIVTALQVDNEGQLWFACHNFSQHLPEGDKAFTPCLHFYRKNVPYHLKVSGRTVLSNVIRNNDAGTEVTGPEVNIMLFKMSIDTVESTELVERKSKNRVELLVEHAYNWMLRHIATQAPRHSLSR